MGKYKFINADKAYEMLCELEDDLSERWNEINEAIDSIDTARATECRELTESEENKKLELLKAVDAIDEEELAIRQAKNYLNAFCREYRDNTVPRPCYFRVHYFEDDDSFEFQTSTDGGNSWGMVCKQKCVNGEMVHYTFLTEIRNAANLGYKAWPGVW